MPEAEWDGTALQALLANIQPTRVQFGTQATTNVLAVIGAAIENTVPFMVEAFISLNNMVVGDAFLVLEEIRDQNDATYREYVRNTYSNVQAQPMIRITPKRCQGWRVSIQRTAGGDRNVTFQFFTDKGAA